MAMQLGATASGADPEPIMDINTTPLIDVMLVLLVMLIITIPIQLHAVNLNLPVGTPPAAPVKPEVVRVDIDARSQVFWNGSAVASRADLQARLKEAAAQPVQPEVHLRPNKQARYLNFAEVMIDVNQAGLHKLGVIGSEQFLDP
ncbi:MAG: ExbD/TolR family protein [Leptothrix sp. (in: b-proteobacteria)]